MERKAKFNMNLAKIMGAVYLLRAFCFTFANLLSLTSKMLATAWGFMLSVKYAIGIVTKKMQSPNRVFTAF
nr:hypothetical protein [uncultured Flavobacterium sp.]